MSFGVMSLMAFQYSSGGQDAGGGAIRFGDDPQPLVERRRKGAEHPLLSILVSFMSGGCVIGCPVLCVYFAPVAPNVAGHVLGGVLTDSAESAERCGSGDQPAR